MTIHRGNSLDILPGLEPESARTCVTSPPYWGLRDYGDQGQDWPAIDMTLSLGGIDVPVHVPGMCSPLGLEPTPIAYVSHLVAIFREVRRVLTADGTLWVNIGDTYSQGMPRDLECHSPRGSRCKIPEILVCAMSGDGWLYRSHIVWNKINPTPESSARRPSKSWESVFLFSKVAKHFYDYESVKVPRTKGSVTRYEREARKGMTGILPCQGDTTIGERSQSRTRDGLARQKGAKSNDPMRRLRDVWTLPVESDPHGRGAGTHLARFPEKLVEPCVLAGSESGDIVLDPFAGSGTVGVVAEDHNRRFVGIELSADYTRIAEERIMTRRAERVKEATAEEILDGQGFISGGQLNETGVKRHTYQKTRALTRSGSVGRFARYVRDPIDDR
jgi:DNA modification methylase